MKYFYLLIALAILSCSPQQSAEEKQPTLEKATVISYENMSVEDFEKAIAAESAVVLDVRTPEEISNGKIEGSEELDFYDKDFAERILAMDKSKDYYIYCKGGGRSAKTCKLMIQNGFENVHNLDGGYTAWKKSKE